MEEGGWERCHAKLGLVEPLESLMVFHGRSPNNGLAYDWMGIGGGMHSVICPHLPTPPYYMHYLPRSRPVAGKGIVSDTRRRW